MILVKQSVQLTAGVDSKRSTPRELHYQQKGIAPQS